jgi:hypothetical protein
VLEAFENLSLAILEGMACGTAVLAQPAAGRPSWSVSSTDLVLADDRPDTIAEGLLGGRRVRNVVHLGERARQAAVTH